MTAVAGFGGLHADEKQVVINPRLYRKWRSLEFNLDYKGDRFRIRLTAGTVTVTPGAANRQAHPFVIAGQAVACAPGRNVAVTYGPAPADGRSAAAATAGTKLS